MRDNETGKNKKEIDTKITLVNSGKNEVILVGTF
jgi:hypothetical protein